MTLEERALINEMLLGKISVEELVRRFRSSTDGQKLGLELLEEACRNRSDIDLQYALQIVFRFELPRESLPLLCEIAVDDWHAAHENVISAVARFRDPSTVDVLYQATQYRPEYLFYDEDRILASKAIWALGSIQDPAADEKLALLSKSGDPILREEAVYQIELRGKGEL